MTAPIDELTFLRKLQRLLDEGEFTATYKLALLNALADLSVERSPAPDGSLHLPLTAIAEKFIEYYWPQVKPFRAVAGAPAVLRQNTVPRPPEGVARGVRGRFVEGRRVGVAGVFIAAVRRECRRNCEKRP